MCGRYSLRRSQWARAVFGALSTTLFDEFTERPRFNIAPSQDVPLVRLNSNEERILGLARWGLIPSWAKDSPKTKPINARAETVLLHSYDSQDMEAHPVSSKVNSPRHDSPDCVEPAGTIEA